MGQPRRPGADVSTFVGLLSVEVFLPDAQSLKDKRMSVRRVKDRLKALGVGVAEVGHLDVWQRAALGVVAIGNRRGTDDWDASLLCFEGNEVAPLTVAMGNGTDQLVKSEGFL